jgi:hypothetical protein
MGLGMEAVLPIAWSVITNVIPILRCLCRNNSEVGIALIKRGGLTTLCNSIEGKNKFGCVLIDIDEAVQSSLTETDRLKIETYKTTGDINSIRNMLLPLYKKARVEYKKNYRGKRIIVISHDVNLLNHVGIENKNIFAYIPSKLLLEQIINDCPDEEVKTIINTQKNEILQSKYKVFIYESYNSLAVQFADKFGLKLRID